MRSRHELDTISAQSRPQALKHPTLFAKIALVAPAVGVPGAIPSFATRDKLAPISHVAVTVVQGQFDDPVPVNQTKPPCESHALANRE